MYIRTTRNKAGQEYQHLVESYREGKKVRQRILLSLGRSDESRMDELITVLSRHREIFSILDVAKEISVEDTYILGPLLVLERLFETSGIDKVLADIVKRHPKVGFGLRKLVFTMVASRFVKPGSKLKIFEHWQNKLYPEMIEGAIALQHLYRALDMLAQHKEEIETGLFWHDRN